MEDWCNGWLSNLEENIIKNNKNPLYQNYLEDLMYKFNDIITEYRQETATILEDIDKHHNSLNISEVDINKYITTFNNIIENNKNEVKEYEEEINYLIFDIKDKYSEIDSVFGNLTDTLEKLRSTNSNFRSFINNILKEEIKVFLTLFEEPNWIFYLNFHNNKQLKYYTEEKNKFIQKIDKTFVGC